MKDREEGEGGGGEREREEERERREGDAQRTPAAFAGKERRTGVGRLTPTPPKT